MQACIMGYMLKVLTVPMRNGNVQLQFDIVLELVGSYRTYEEWKLIETTSSIDMEVRSYRTYEEWKHVEFAYGWQMDEGSYRTYEEWKRI